LEQQILSGFVITSAHPEGDLLFSGEKANFLSIRESSNGDISSRQRSEAAAESLWLAQCDMGARFGRIPSLDGLRAFSILLVMLMHLGVTFIPGSFGVLVFFAISGFLITRLLFAELKQSRSVNLKRFYARRILRLYPIVMIYTLLSITVFLTYGLSITWIEPLSALFYFTNYLYADPNFGGAMPFAIFWSLSVEEHFYLFFPIIFVLVAGNVGRLTVVILSVCFICPLLRLVVSHLHPELLHSVYFYYRSEFRLDSISYGVMLAVACESETGRSVIRSLLHPISAIAAIFLILATFVIRGSWFHETLRYSMQSIGATMLLAALLFSDKYRPLQVVLNFGPIRWIGVLSYSLYVWHWVVPLVVEELLPGLSTVPKAVIKFVFCIIVAAVSYYAIERPFMKVRHKFGSRARE